MFGQMRVKSVGFIRHYERPGLVIHLSKQIRIFHFLDLPSTNSQVSAFPSGRYDCNIIEGMLHENDHLVKGCSCKTRYSNSQNESSAPEEVDT